MTKDTTPEMGAKSAIVAFEQVCGTADNPADSVATLLHGLMHLCKKHPLAFESFQLALDVARYRFAEDHSHGGETLSTKMP